MGESKETIATHGMGEFHHVKAQDFRPDPNYRADKKTLDKVWDIIQGKVDVSKIEEPETGEVVSVPVEYVNAVAWWALRRLKQLHAGKEFSVGVVKEEPIVLIEFVKEFHGVLNERGETVKMGKRQTTDCAAGFMQGIDPERLGQDAAVFFMQNLEVGN